MKLSTRLTTRPIDAAKPQERTYFIWEGGPKALGGFGLAVHPTGRKVFCVRYVTRGGRDRRLTVGRYGALTPEEARDLAAKALGRVAAGEDPAESRRAVREAPTVREAFAIYERDHLAQRRESTRVEVARLFAKHVLPSIGSRKLELVTPDDVQAIHSTLTETPYQANRVLAWVAAFFTFAERRRLIPGGSNPTRGITRYPEERRQHHLSLAELAVLGRQLDSYERKGADRWEQVQAVRLGILLGSRLTSEILRLPWAFVDWERRLIKYPPSAIKTKKTTLRALGPEAMAILEDVRDRQDAHGSEEWVFPSRRKPGRPRRTVGDLLRRVFRDSQIKKPGILSHIFRHTVQTHAAELGYSELLIDSMMGKAGRSITAGYTHVNIDGATRQVAEAVQRRICAALTRRKPAPVIPLVAALEG